MISLCIEGLQLLSWTCKRLGTKNGSGRSHLWSEQRALASHQRVALLLDVDKLLSVEVRQFAPVLALPWTPMPDVVGQPAELSVPVEDEEVEVVDGAEGLVVHLRPLLSRR
jgi:hypothetical protein